MYDDPMDNSTPDAIPDPTEAEIVRALHGHICRCGVYQRIVAAIKAAAKTMREDKA